MLEMPRHASPLECSVETRTELIAISRSRTGEVRMVERARIVLASADGLAGDAICTTVGVSAHLALCCLATSLPSMQSCSNYLVRKPGA